MKPAEPSNHASATLPGGIGAGLFFSLWLGILGLVLTPLYIHFFGIENYGLIGLYMALIAMAGMLDVALSSTAGREIARLLGQEDGIARIARLVRSTEAAYLAVVCISTAALTSLAWLTGPSWIQSGTMSDRDTQITLVLIGLAIGTTLPSGLYAASLIGLGSQARSAILMGTFGTIKGLGAVMIAWWVSRDIRLFFAWLALLGLAQTLWMRRQVWRAVSIKRAPPLDWRALGDIRAGIGAMFVITMLGLVTGQMDKLILSWSVPLEHLGHYALAWSAASALTLVAVPIAQGIGASLSRLTSSDTAALFVVQLRTATQLVLALALAPAVVASNHAEAVVFAWIGDRAIATAAAPVLSVLLIGMAMISAVFPLLHGLYARHYYRPVIFVQLACIAVFVPLLMFLVKSHAALGAAWSWTSYGAVLFVAYTLLSSRAHGSPALLPQLCQDVCLIGGSAYAVAAICAGWLDHLQTGAENLKLPMIAISAIIAISIAIGACTNLRKHLGARLRLMHRSE